MSKIITFMMKKGYETGNRVYYPESICPCQTARQYKDPYKILENKEGNMRIRKLTPTETERLQSFPPDLTKYGRKTNGTVYKISDTQRYKLCGNAVTSNVSKNNLGTHNTKW